MAGKTKKSTGTGIMNMGVGVFEKRQQQLRDASKGKQPRTIPSTMAENRTNKPRKR